MNIWIKIIFARALVLILFASSAHAYSLEVQCGPDGELKTHEVKGSDLSWQLQAKIKQGLRTLEGLSSGTPREHCDSNGAPVAPAPDLPGIALVSDLNSRARIWSTRPPNRNTWFDPGILRDVVKRALAEGIDPYLALAVSIMENPPYTRSVKDNPYDYGRMGGSVNSIAILDAFGCAVAKTPKDLGSRLRVSPEEIKKAASEFDDVTVVGAAGFSSGAPDEEDDLPPDLEKLQQDDPEKFLQLSCFGKPKCKGLIIPGKASRSLDLSDPGFPAAKTEPLDVCFGDIVDHPSSYPQFAPQSEQRAGKCCAKVILNAGTHGAPSFESLVASLQANVFFDRIRRKVVHAQQIASAQREGLDRMSWLIQGYNGRGTVPAWSDSECLAGVDMDKNPVYGATVGDLMLNMLMTSPDVEALVAGESASAGKPQKSLLCTVYGEGRHQIDSLEFARLEESYLSGGSRSGDRRQRCAKDVVPMSYRPWTDREAKSFLGE